MRYRRALQKLLILLTTLAFVIGIGEQAMASASLITRAHANAEHTVMREDCAAMTEDGNAGSAPIKQSPCKRIACTTPCICPAALPAPPTALASPVAWGRLSYWPRLAAVPAELSFKPDLPPPIAA